MNRARRWLGEAFPKSNRNPRVPVRTGQRYVNPKGEPNEPATTAGVG